MTISLPIDEDPGFHAAKSMIAKHFLEAYNKGRKAALENPAGQAHELCPYPDYRGGKYDHIITFSRPFRKYWAEGFQDAKAGLPSRYPG